MEAEGGEGKVRKVWAWSRQQEGPRAGTGECERKVCPRRTLPARATALIQVTASRAPPRGPHPPAPGTRGLLTAPQTHQAYPNLRHWLLTLPETSSPLPARGSPPQCTAPFRSLLQAPLDFLWSKVPASNPPYSALLLSSSLEHLEPADVMPVYGCPWPAAPAPCLSWTLAASRAAWSCPRRPVKQGRQTPAQALVLE